MRTTELADDVAAAPGKEQSLSWPLTFMLALVALLALAGPALIVANVPRVLPDKTIVAVTGPKRVIPKTELPPVEPVAVVALKPEDARAINASVPFSTLPNPAARGFHVFGAAADQARAIDCLAAAVYYEAGDDAVGQKAVAQVVLNRVRHPAFPKSVCGVVFQGSERSTGCQFTFTCDGALMRTPSPAAWQRARDVARLALTGSVYKPVGHATHYHTDWVVPYWSSSLEKITEVHTHLFFRWTGWWGTPPAFNRGYAGAEPVIAKLGSLSPLHYVPGSGLGVTPLDIAALAPGDLPSSLSSDPNSFLVTLDKRMSPDAFAALAIRTCGERPYCKFMGWTDPAKAAKALPLNPAQMGAMSFSYLRDERTGFAKALWNCDEFRRPSPVQCMRSQLIPRPPVPGAVAVDTTKAGTVPTTPAAPGAAAPGGLSGVRRKPEPTPTPAPPPAVRFTLPAPQQDNR